MKYKIKSILELDFINADFSIHRIEVFKLETQMSNGLKLVFKWTYQGERFARTFEMKNITFDKNENIDNISLELASGIANRFANCFARFIYSLYGIELDIDSLEDFIRTDIIYWRDNINENNRSTDE